MREVLKIEDLLGQAFDRLTIVSEAPPHREPSGKRQRVMTCSCSCGGVVNKQLKDLRKGIAKSCGCIHSEKIVDISKQTIYNNWTILEEVAPYVTKDGSKTRKMLCECKCGTKKEVLLNALRCETSKSCGCLERLPVVRKPQEIQLLNLEKVNQRDFGDWIILSEISAKRNEKEEIVRTVEMQCKCGYIKECKLENANGSKSCSKCAMKLRKSLISDEDREINKSITSRHAAIKARCNNPNSKDYKNYGGRGIKLYEDWNKLENFRVWCLNNGFKIELEIDRENNDGDYCPDNCRFITKTNNNRNMSRTVMNWEYVEKIRQGEWKNLSSEVIGKLINCSRATVSSVRQNKTWREGTE